MKSLKKNGKIIVINNIDEGVNLVKRHTKPSASNPQGGIEEKEGTIHVSNLMLVVAGQATRVGRKENDKGKLVRFSKKSGEMMRYPFRKTLYWISWKNTL